RLLEYARSDKLLNELPYWRRAAAASVLLPLDRPGGDNLERSSDGVSVSLSTEETRALLQDVPPVYRTQITEVLLAALVQAVGSWTGAAELTVDLESHG